MLKRLVEFFLMMMGISATDEESKQRQERERWDRQKRDAEHEEQRRHETDARTPDAEESPQRPGAGARS